MNFKGYGNGQPGQYTHEFTVFRRKNKKTATGRVAKDCEMKTPFVIPDGILAEASQKEQEAWAQNQHPHHPHGGILSAAAGRPGERCACADGWQQPAVPGAGYRQSGRK